MQATEARPWPDAVEFAIELLQSEPDDFHRIVLLVSQEKDEGRTVPLEKALRDIDKASISVSHAGRVESHSVLSCQPIFGKQAAKNLLRQSKPYTPSTNLLFSWATHAAALSRTNRRETTNYDADIRLGHRLSPHLYLDMFATANNTRDYYSQGVGFNLKFMIDRIPTSTDLLVNWVPDWTGKPPFAIR